MSKKPAAPSIMSKDEAFKLCDTIAKQGLIQDSRIQRAAVTAIGYSVIHGDCTIAQRMIEVFPAGARLTSLVAFFEALGNLQWDKAQKTVVHIKDEDRLEPTEKDVAALLVLCNEVQWHVYGPRPEPKSEYDSIELMKKLVVSLQKKAKKSGITVTHQEKLDAMMQLLTN